MPSEARWYLSPTLKNSHCLHTWWGPYGEPVVTQPRNHNMKGQQQLRLQVSNGAVYIRFDRHPQPGLYQDPSCEPGAQARLGDARTDAHNEWAIVTVSEWDKVSNDWNTNQQVDLASASSARGRKFQVLVVSRKSGHYLCFKDKHDGGYVVTRPLSDMVPNKGEKLTAGQARENLTALIKAGILWELEYGDSAFSAKDCAIIGALAALPVVALAGPAAAAALGPTALALGGMGVALQVSAFGAACLPAAVAVESAVLGMCMKDYGPDALHHIRMH
eukprot:TRINITY_DN93937_c0_g1_i1.p1 TRINITY_DN93937_c0_g1~~TRINITY_DN93937_c0_g1_i1.p1  ORF type:complete len:275 (-),score=24.63 TRINITY_DN93937_c0_g1_i1:54-878(-)